MTVLFLDSSAWVARYRPEEGREEIVDAIVASHRGIVVTNQLVDLETQRSIRARSRPEDVDERLQRYREDREETSAVDMGDDVWLDAHHVVSRTRIRTLDALHIAAVRRLGRQAILLTFDQRQADAAREMGVMVAGV